MCKVIRNLVFCIPIRKNVICESSLMRVWIIFPEKFYEGFGVF